MEVQFSNGAVYLPQIRLWLDPHEPQPGLVFVSHAHSDHIADHKEVIVTEATAQLMQARLPGARTEHVLPFFAPRRFSQAPVPFELTLLPAGHIFGSAMALLRAEDGTLLYTGDFKLRQGLSAERCQPERANVLIMETTFGRPHYVFPPTADVLRGIVRFCREALDNDETPVLLGYSLGKSQELLCALGEEKLPLMLHGMVFKLTQIYERFGKCFPPYERYVAHAARGKVLLCPPNVINSAMLRNIGKVRTAVLTGWAVDPNCKYRYQCDAAFPLSDHADFPGLLELVERVQPSRIYTLHGFAAEFAQTLRDRGLNAQALSEDEQFSFQFGPSLVPTANRAPKRTDPAPREGNPPAAPPSETTQLFGTFAETCRLICTDSRKLEKVRLLAAYLQTLGGESLAWATTWFCGRPFPATRNKVLQLGWAVLRDAICSVAAVPEVAFHSTYLKYSDLGEAAAELLNKNPSPPRLTLADVSKLFDELHAARGPIAKLPWLRDVLQRATSAEAKYLVKIITGDLRIGLKEGLVEEAIASAFQLPLEQIRKAHLLIGDLAETAKLAQEKRLESASLTPFRPVKFMLASPEQTAADIWSRLQEGALSPAPEDRDVVPLSAWIEDKYDGVRCQLHKQASRVALYSRDLKDITATFLDLADAMGKLDADVILDGEIVAMTNEEVLPFAELQKRLGRREADLFMAEEVPIKLIAFDLLWLNGRTLLDTPLKDRRRQLEGLAMPPTAARLARITPATSVDQIEAAFTGARARGNEGLMIKDPQSGYTPGRRGLAWLKLKKAFATLDCVVVGAEFGHGKRSKVLSDYTFAVRDETTGELKTIGKAYSGLTDVEIAGLTEHFLNTATRQRGRYFEVPPDTVLEIAFDRLQRSERHTSGLAMRFPRIARIRTDKSAADIDSVQTALELLRRLEARETSG